MNFKRIHAMSMPRISSILVLALAALLSGCASLGVGREPPSVFLQSFQAVPNGSGSGLPAFEIVLRVLNPNPEPIRLRGAVYSIKIDGKRLVEGVTNSLPLIDGYGEGTVRLDAAVDVIGGVRLLADLMNQPRDRFEYSLEARLDPEGFGRDIRVEESGEVELRPRTR